MEVVNDIVHVNVPLTPILTGTVHTLQTSLSGFSQSNLLVPPGSVVKWLAVQGAQEEMSDLIRAQTDPVLPLILSPNPFSSITGWDSGHLIPSKLSIPPGYHRNLHLHRFRRAYGCHSGGSGKQKCLSVDAEKPLIGLTSEAHRVRSEPGNGPPTFPAQWVVHIRLGSARCASKKKTSDPLTGWDRHKNCLH